MYGGTITGNEGGVDVSSGTFTLYDGKICGNIAEEGGGVNVNYDGRFYMEGGEISGNTASRNGGGICISGVTVITGGKISDNSAEAGGGLYVMCPLEETVFCNAEFSGNKADWGAGLYVDLDGAEVE
ncbi:MAG: hypothetical protein IJM37_09005, partial [Lachnospiraceae bacterium]|nr:hypothetical protein [Lachnospiraceae bacterium]